MNNQLSKIRKVLQNPYAFLNDSDDFAYSEADQLTVSTKKKWDILHQERFILQDPYAYLGEYDVVEIVDTDRNHVISLSKLKKCGTIAEKVKYLHTQIWRKRNIIWPDTPPQDPVDMLRPEITIGLLGYEYIELESLGKSEEFIGKVAGLVDQSDKRIVTSREFNNKVRRFTAAHELGHVVMHHDVWMHRDRPIDGSDQKREGIEVEADKFATYFLMPEKLVKQYFAQNFGVNIFSLNDDTAFALDPGNKLELMKKHLGRRDISRLLAKAEIYNGDHIRSLANSFHVSDEAMAIRIEELGLIAW